MDWMEKWVLETQKNKTLDRLWNTYGFILAGLLCLAFKYHWCIHNSVVYWQ